MLPDIEIYKVRVLTKPFLRKMIDHSLQGKQSRQTTP
jgi:hypothetical protein